MSGDCNIYGGFIVSSSSTSTNASWGDIKGNILNQSDLIIELDKKVDKVEGKSLSSNDFTDELKEKLNNINKVYLISIEKSWNKISDDVYTQSIPVNGIKKDEIAIVNVELSDDPILADKELEAWNKISRIVINDGSIVIYCFNGTPSVEIKIKIKI